ncbi:MAG: HAD family phosphatase [Burkholderiales bacterium]|nr:HAD family phosphatase [Burkholderiales bacterium]
MATARIKGILWDNDGVLVDTEHHFYEANRQVLAQHGVDLTPRQFLDWFMLDNCGAWHLLTARGYTQQQIHQLRQQRNALQSELLRQCPSHSLALPGMPALVKHLAPQVAMGVVTSSLREHFDIIHRELEFVPHMQFVLADDSYANSKPAPDPYLLGLRRLGLTAAECLVVEDSPRGLLAAMVGSKLPEPTSKSWPKPVTGTVP